ncbi:MAG: cyclase family protein, partial [Bacteroidota bacterium]
IHNTWLALRRPHHVRTLHRSSMIIELNHKGQAYTTDLSRPHDISIPLQAGPNHVRAWYLDPMRIEPVRMGDWVGAVDAGAAVNFFNIQFNPHGHGTHTESCGHITPKVHSINGVIKNFIFRALLISVKPSATYNTNYEVMDHVITHDQMRELIGNRKNLDAVIVRTIPNDEMKVENNYSNTNPPFFEEKVVDVLNECNVIHFLTDLPSVDREIDGGRLAFHHRFWRVPENPDMDRTITELVYVSSEIVDGDYILEMQVAPIENDASPCRPVLYEIKTATNSDRF